MAKFYGSRFCRRCGVMFPIIERDDQICASCEQQPAEPPATKATAARPVTAAATVTAQAIRPVPRKRRASAPRRAPGRNQGPVTGPRTLPMLRALADAPAGLATPQLAQFASAAASWINALGSTRVLMLKQERLGRVRQAGTVEGDRTRESVLWRITEEGERYVREAKPLAERYGFERAKGDAG